MKLRNKKTGEINNGRIEVIFQNDNKFPNPLERHVVGSFAELNEEWEEVKEPLIKDQKIRKAVRAWAEANGASRAYIVDLGMLRDESSGNEIKFNGEPFVGWLTSLKTITELCGEEQE